VLIPCCYNDETQFAQAHRLFQEEAIFMPTTIVLETEWVLRIMGQYGIHIRGRSRKLYINYRTTEKIRNWSMNVLQGITIDDMDGGADEHTA
jgi:hypothetical protein